MKCIYFNDKTFVYVRIQLRLNIIKENCVYTLFLHTYEGWTRDSQPVLRSSILALTCPKKLIFAFFLLLLLLLLLAVA
jgi:hypothetical protein